MATVILSFQGEKTRTITHEFIAPQEDRLEILRVLHGARDYVTIFAENNL